MFFEILEELDIPPLTKSSLLEKVDEVIIQTYGIFSRQYIVQYITEEKWMSDVARDIEKCKRKKLISTFKKRLISKAVNFEIIGKENYESTLKKINEIKENTKRLRDQKEIEAKKERLFDQMDLERLAAAPDWQKEIKKHKKIKEGYIYILSNLGLPRTFKIGFVKDDPEARAKQLKSATGLETDFIIEKLWKTKNPYKVEQKIFSSLQMQKNKNGEYYGKSYRLIKEMNGTSFTEFVNGESLKFFCERIEKFIQE